MLDMYCLASQQDTALSFLCSCLPLPESWYLLLSSGAAKVSPELLLDSVVGWGSVSATAHYRCWGSGDWQGTCLWGDVYSKTYLSPGIKDSCPSYVLLLKWNVYCFFGNSAGLVQSHLCRKWKSPWFLSLVGRDSNCHSSGTHSDSVISDF